MGMLIDGQWRDEDPPAEIGKAGNFQRVDSAFRDRITADGSSGFKAEAGRYHLYVAYTCPWAHRTQIYRALKKLTGAISVAIAVPGLRQRRLDVRGQSAFPDCIARPRQRLPLSARGLQRRAIRITPAR